MQTYTVWQNGLGSGHTVKVRSNLQKNAISVRPCMDNHSKDNNTETNLQWLNALVKNLRANLNSIKVVASHCKPL